MSSNPALSARFRRDQASIVTLARRDLRAFWVGVDTSDPEGVRRAVLAFLPDLVQTYGEMGAAVAADFYDELRDGSGDVRRAYRSLMPDEVVRIGQVEASARWALGPLFGTGDNPGPAQALANLTGTVTRLTLAPARDTIRANVGRDPDSTGWRRVGNGDSCKFCRMLIGRGEIYSAETARFGSHDWCSCHAEPAFDAGQRVRVEQYVATKRRVSAADRARVRDYMAGMDDVVPAPAAAAA